MTSQITVQKTKVITKATEMIKSRGALFKSHGDPASSNIEGFDFALEKALLTPQLR